VQLANLPIEQQTIFAKVAVVPVDHPTLQPTLELQFVVAFVRPYYIYYFTSSISLVLKIPS